jgi:NADPH-dependent glutamate synthase beta subunit-like oxidoreductase/Pyruvate/2-oxoacid:ferredoxin oxidoreductase delta subunit
MKRPKDRLHKVIVIGATPAGIAATNKLGELGIPVTLVDRESDLNRKLARDEWKLASGLGLNYAHRPGLIRLLRNPMIRCILPAEVQSVKHTPQGFRVQIKAETNFVDSERCTLCGRCEAVCPVTTSQGTKPIDCPGRRALPGRPKIEKRREPLCQAHCPLGVNAQGYIALTQAGKYQEALDLVRKDNVLPSICGRVCTHPCEAACRRGLLDEPIDIRNIKRFLADRDSRPRVGETRKNPSRKERIAVIGSGPAGLAAAADLARKGYGVTVFEKESYLGGLLRYGIGPHRLPREVLDRDLEYIQNLGIQFKTTSRINLPEDFQALRTEFNAIILSGGAWTDRKLGVPGEDLEGVEGCIAFLNRIYRGEIQALKENVAVIGDGNAAFDLARALVRIGARVTLLSWFPEELIPAAKEEVRGAKEEDVALLDKTQVVGFSGQNGKLLRLICRPTAPGEPDAQGIPWPVIVPESEPFELSFDRAFVAIGQNGPFSSAAASGLGLSQRGFITVDSVWRTTLESVFASGDAVKGPSSVVDAMASGRAAARAVHESLNGSEDAASESWRPEDRDFSEIPSNIPSQARPTMSERQPAARCDNFMEVALGLSESQVLSESERCLQCGVCSQCNMCTEVCEAVRAIDHATPSETLVEHAGVVIIADPDVPPPTVRGEDIIRAYGPTSAKTDVYAMMTRGFASAAQAMILLGGTSHRPKGRGLSFSPPEPGLSAEVRLGVFVCRCNDAFGWTEGMGDYVGHLWETNQVAYGEVLQSACIPEGSAAILKAIRERGLTRVVLASCVCCPLDFVCSACTDQRSRLKDALFKGTGISRAMVETCNLRGEVLRFLPADPGLTLDRFKGLIERSMGRAKRLKALPSPARAYNFTTAVIGESEASISSAMALAETGIEVFMFGTTEKPLSEKVAHRNITSFEGSSVLALSGTIGDFHVFVQKGDFRQTLPVGAIIIGESSRRKIPYVPQAGLPSRLVASAMQKRGVADVPFLYPGSTSIAGLFLASPQEVPVSERKKGAAAAVLAAAHMPRGPRQSKGYTVVIHEDLCRGCGRCLAACLYQAISLQKNQADGWSARVDEALCKGCGNCISVCPSNAADSPYRDQAYLEQLLEEVLM